MRLHFLGTGDAFCSGGRFQTCFLLEAGGLRALIDCGATSMLAMRRAGVDPDGLDLVILSHLHGDHFGGLPFLLLDAVYAAGRTRPLTVLGPPGTKARVDQASEAFFPGSSTLERPFPLHMEEMPPGGTRRFGGMEVRSAEVVHPSGAPSTALRIEADGKALAFSGDTEWTDALTEVTRGADLFVCECYAPHGPVDYHLDAETLLAKRDTLGAKRMLITHMGRAMLPTPPHPLLERAETGWWWRCSPASGWAERGSGTRRHLGVSSSRIGHLGCHVPERICSAQCRSAPPQIHIGPQHASTPLSSIGCAWRARPR